MDPCLGSAHNTRTPTSSCTTPTVQPAMRAESDSGDRATGSSSAGGGPSRDLPSLALPYPDRVALCTIASAALKDRPRLRVDEIWDALSELYNPLEESLVQIQYVREDRFRVWCSSPEVLEDFVHRGATVRGHPIMVYPYRDRSWVTITHLPYGVTEEDVIVGLEPYGTIHEVNFVTYRKIRTGTVKVRMDLKRAIPTRIRVNGYPGLAYHQGQVRTCFNCGAVGHESRKCPKKLAAKAAEKVASKSASATKSGSGQKRKRSRRRKSASASEGKAGLSSSGTEPRQAKRVTPSMETDEGAPVPPDSEEVVGGARDDSLEMDQVAPEPPTVGDPASEESSPEVDLFANPIPDYLFQENKEAAKAAPPDKNDAEHPRNPKNRQFRKFDTNWVYVEEGELSRSLPNALVEALSVRGDAIRDLFDECKTGMRVDIGHTSSVLIRCQDQVRIRKVSHPSRREIFRPFDKYRVKGQKSSEAVPPSGGGASG